MENDLFYCPSCDLVYLEDQVFAAYPHSRCDVCCDFVSLLGDADLFEVTK